MLTLCCSPEPRLRLEGVAESAGERALHGAWSHGEAAGVLWLATAGLRERLEPSLVWARHWAQLFLARLCQTREPLHTEAPSEQARQAFIGSVPPMLGAENVSESLLLALWQAMAQRVHEEAGSDLEAWLKAHGDVWHLVGRVTFHLAENKRDAERPFAFMATFTEQVSSSGQLQHLPLARAQEFYSKAGDVTALHALLKPVRLAAECSALVKRLLESKQLFHPLAWTPAEAWQLVRDMALLQQCGVVMKVPDWWKGGRPPRPAVQVSIEVPESGAKVGVGAMLGFSMKLSMGDEALTSEEIALIKSSPSGLVSLRGQWVELDHEKLDQVMTHWQRVQQLHANGQMTFHEGMRYLAGFGGPGMAVDLNGGLTEASVAEWSSVVSGKHLSALLEQLHHPAEEAAPPELQGTLRPYQLKGFAWLRFMQRLGFGACLADDMGLGKTVQVIASLLAQPREGVSPSLIVAPASLIGNWKAELARFAPSLKVYVAHQSAVSREELQALQPHALTNKQVVVTTYQFITRGKAMQAIDWNLVVLDEAQAIKNPGTAQTRAVKKLRSRARLALTGTPVENRPGDLWSLFDFLNPGLLGSPTVFAETLKRLTRPSGTDYGPLRRLVQPYLLRRMKTDRRIISDLPEKIEMNALCPLTRRQAVIYTRLVEELKRTLADQSLPPIQRNGQVLSFLIKFKQVCNHPSHWNGDGQFKPDDSGKFQRLAELAEELAARQDRVLVFTQFQEMCAPLAEHLARLFGRPGLVLHGGTPVAQRAKLVEQFQAGDGPPFFVISVKAGGTGLTLTAANHVIHFDRWWNPAVENQATDRAFRIGQKRNVLVHKFVVPGTIEERIDRLMHEKQALATGLLGSDDGVEKLLTELSADELLRLVALDVNTVEG